MIIAFLLVITRSIVDAGTWNARFNCGGYGGLDCLINRAIEKNDIGACNYFLGYYGLNGATCTKKFAEQKGLSLEQCKELKNGRYLELCLEWSGIGGDFRYCSEIDSDYSKASCYLDAAIRNRHVDWCIMRMPYRWDMW